jgi:UDP-N-acetylglucosamine 2-epimerase
MVRFNITVPDRIAQKLTKVGNKSRFISEAVEEKIKTQEKETRMITMAQEYKEMASEQVEFMKDWSVAETEGWD